MRATAQCRCLRKSGMADDRDIDIAYERRPKRLAPTDVLPDFCSAETLLRVLVLAILLSLVIPLLRNGLDDPFMAIAPTVLFIAWVALTSLMVLCLLQRWLRRARPLWQVLVPAAVPVVNTALVHLAAEHFALVDGGARLQVVLVAALLSLIAMHYFYLIAAWKQETQAVAQAREQALRARVRPHFLFNSMNSIAGLCRSDPARAEQVTLDLADLFRATFATGEQHSLAEELDLARAYLAIEQTRFGDRLQLEWDVADVSDVPVQVPALVLQPLVENAIQHGVAPSSSGARVWVRAQRQDSGAVIEIGNTVGNRTGAGTQTAGNDVRARLRHCFGERAGFAVDRSADRFEVRVTLPLSPANGASPP